MECRRRRIAPSTARPSTANWLRLCCIALRSRLQAFLLRADYLQQAQAETSDNLKLFYEKITSVYRCEESFYQMACFLDNTDEVKSLRVSGAEQSGRTSERLASAMELYIKSLRCGSTNVLHALPRVLTMWMQQCEVANKGKTSQELEMPQSFHRRSSSRSNQTPATASSQLSPLEQRLRSIGQQLVDLPGYQLYSSLPQILSAVGQTSPLIREGVKRMITKVVRLYPHQAMWHLIASVQNTRYCGRDRALVKNDSESQFVREVLDECVAVSDERGPFYAQLLGNMDALVNQLLIVSQYEVAKSCSNFSMKYAAPGLFNFFNLPIQLQQRAAKAAVTTRGGRRGEVLLH